MFVIESDAEDGTTTTTLIDSDEDDVNIEI